MLLSIVPLLLPLSFTAQEPAAKAPAQWTQAELESLSDTIRQNLEKIRGVPFKRPVAVKLADKQKFLEYVRKRVEVSQTPARVQRDETIAKMLGLIPPDMDLVKTMESFLQQQVGGFYDPGSDTFYLMETFTGDIAKVILAHELTHALDDQYYDMDGAMKKLGEDTDAEWAYWSLCEGSGTAAMTSWTFMHMGELDKDSLKNAGNLGMEGLDTAPQFVWKPLLGGYLRGQVFVTHSGHGMPENVDRAFHSPPRSSEQILHPDKYWVDAKRDEPRRIEFDTAKLPKDWKVLGEDTLGELMLALVATPIADRKPLDPTNPFAMMALAFTNAAAEGWGGDRALLLGKGDERRLELATVWDTPEDAREFQQACTAVFATVPTTSTGMPAGLSAELVGGNAVVVHAHWGAGAAAVTGLAWHERK